MLIVDESVETSSGDRVTIIEHRPVKSFEEEKALYVRPLPRTAGFQILPFFDEKTSPNLREIAGNRAYNYLAGKRYYVMTDEEEKEPFLSRSFPKILGFVCVAAGIAVLAVIYFMKG